jgi:hypothetical protein
MILVTLAKSGNPGNMPNGLSHCPALDQALGGKLLGFRLPRGPEGI